MNRERARAEIIAALREISADRSHYSWCDRIFALLLGIRIKRDN